MGLEDILLSAAAALALALGAAPGQMLLAVLLFLACAEGLMFIPRVGFLFKFAVASLLAPQILAMYRVAALGESPPLRILADAAYLPISSMLVLVACALLPFFIGLCYFAVNGRADAFRFFFGNILKHKAPEGRHFLAFKVIMHVAAVPFTFVAPAMILKGYIGGNALEQGLVAGLVYWPALLAILLVSLAFELVVSALPRRLGGLLSIPLLAAFLMFMFAFIYTLSLRAFGL